ncbi:MAG: phosphopentomutase [Bacteroidetes bacterium]|nr:MAG: phosphopentomutase [Bacteroidota bacterium]
MQNTKRVILIVLDSVGIGELPDAARFGDEGSNTVGNIARQLPLRLPNLLKLGLGNITELGIGREEAPLGAYGRAAEASPGKDTTTGHWEIAGLVMQQPFPTYPQGFPPEIMQPFEQAIGTKTLANKAASGTAIIEEFGPLHQQTGYPIVYTSADSVFQIAMHEATIPIERQYEICQIARDLLTGRHAVGRVIARPFEGQPGAYKRTSRRKDFSLKPPGKTVLQSVKAAGKAVQAVGKIIDIFAGDGITEYVKTENNMQGVDRTLDYMQQQKEGLIFTNLVDFDMLYGHRNDVQGYANALMAFDRRLPEIVQALQPQDVLIVTADHGCDPTTPSTDHSREYIPILCYGQGLSKGVDVGTRPTFADIGATVAELLKVEPPEYGQSFANEICA